MKIFSQEEINEIIRLYTIDMLGTPTIGKKFNISKRTINNLLNKNNIIIGKSGGKFKGGKKISDKKYREKNKEKAKKYQENYHPIYYQENKEMLIDKHKTYRENNKEKEQIRHKIYRENNADKIKIYRISYKEIRNLKHIEKMKINPLYKLKHNIRGLIKNGFKSKYYIKQSKTQDILGCSFEEFKLHLESQFENWMNWDNFGNSIDGIIEPNKTWDIDHIIPISLAKTEEDIIKLNHFTNLQPLCSYENRFIKRNKLLKT
jgi:hypothetical protein